MDGWKTQEQFHAETQRNRIDFLESDLALCGTFADIANTELSLGEAAAAAQAFLNAEAGYTTITRLLLDVENPEHRAAIEVRAEALRARLEELQTRLHSS